MSIIAIPGIARGRRRIVAVAALVVVIVSLGISQVLSAFASGSPTRPVDRQLSSYVLFAFDTLAFKGGQTPGRGEIHGGDVGAGGVDNTPNNSSPTLNICANDKVVMDPGSQVVADSMRISNLCTVWDVYANHLTAGSNVVPQNSGPTGFSLPLLSSNPSFPSFSCNAGNPFTLSKHLSTMLPPGTYGAVTLQDDTTTTLQPGIYNMCSLHVGKNATVTTVAGVELHIAQDFSVSNETTFGPQCDVPVYVRADGLSGANDVAVSFSKHTQIAGHFLTLTGHMDLGDDTDLSGQFVADTISSDKNVNIDGCANTPPTTTSSSSSSTSTSSTSTSSTATTSTSSTSTSSTTTTSVAPTSTEASTSTSTSTSTTSTSTSTSTSSSTTSTSIVSASSTEATTSTSTSTSTSTPTSTSTSTSSTSSTTSTTVQPAPRHTTTTRPSSVTSAGLPESSTTSSVPTPITPAGSPEGPSTLPFTGSGSGLLDLGFLGLVIGGALVGYSRRRPGGGPAH